MEQDGRDPYLGIWNEMRGDNDSRRCAPYAIGYVAEGMPKPRIRCGELTLSGDDLRFARHLLAAAGEPVRQNGFVVEIPEPPPGVAVIQYPVTPDAILETPGALLQAGDEVLMIPSEDGEIYYVIDKVVSL